MTRRASSTDMPQVEIPWRVPNARLYAGRSGHPAMPKLHAVAGAAIIIDRASVAADVFDIADDPSFANCLTCCRAEPMASDIRPMAATMSISAMPSRTRQAERSWCLPKHQYLP